MMRRTGYLVILRARKPRRVLSNSAARLSRHSGERRSSPSSQPTWAVSAFCAQNRRPGRQYCAQKVPRLPAGSPQPQLLSSLLAVQLLQDLVPWREGGGVAQAPLHALRLDADHEGVCGVLREGIGDGPLVEFLCDSGPEFCDARVVAGCDRPRRRRV